MTCSQPLEAIIDSVYGLVATLPDERMQEIFDAVKTRRDMVRTTLDSLSSVSQSVLAEVLAIMERQKKARRPALSDPNVDLLEDDEETTLPDGRLFEDVPATGSLTAPRSMLGPAFIPPRMPQPPAQR